jgi:hypothetical protein
LVSQNGCSEPDPKEHLDEVPALEVAEVWQRMHNGKWVIGVSICNNGKR